MSQKISETPNFEALSVKDFTEIRKNFTDMVKNHPKEAAFVVSGLDRYAKHS